MYINFHNDTHSINFKAKPLYPIKLRTFIDGNTEKFLPANFYELSTQNFDDIKLVENIKKEWKKDESDYNIAQQIANKFLGFKNHNYHNKFYITALDGNNDIYERTTSILETTNPNTDDFEFFDIAYLFSKSVLTKFKSQIKDAGKMSVYGAFKLAKDYGFDNIYINSMNNNFYKKIGLTPTRKLDDDVGLFIIPNEEFSEIISQIEKKYLL